MIYLDNNATTRPADAVADAMDEVNRTLWANPSSVHRLGQQVRHRIELARASVAGLVGCKPRELVFTSGGSESNTLALRGVLDKPRSASRPSVLITTAVEHAVVREVGQALAERGVELVWVPVDREGRVDARAVEAAAAEHARAGSVVVVSIQWANNETGVIQPIEEIAQAMERVKQQASRRRVVLHVDGTQAVGKLPVDLGDAALAGVDLLSFAGHKFHGPKGVGGLVIRSGLRLVPQQRGGPQERDRRGGTENTAGIVGMGVAAELAQGFVGDFGRIDELEAMRDRFEHRLAQRVGGDPDQSGGGGEEEGTPPPGRDGRTRIGGGVVVNSGRAARLWNTSNLALPGLEAEAILLGLSERGVCASAGAACSSGSLDPSPVLLAMGLEEAVAHGSVRFSISRETTGEELDAAAEAVAEVVQRLGRTMPMGRGDATADG